MKYPEFCCQCCGYTNGDMYYDWFVQKNGRPPKRADWIEYWQYRAHHYQTLYEDSKPTARVRTDLRGRRVGSVSKKGQK